MVATVALATDRRWSRPLAVAACSVELAGVLAIGTLSLLRPEDFPRATVWSGYGSGYGFVPLVLPVIGLWWLRRTSGSRRPMPSDRDAGSASSAFSTGCLRSRP